MSVSPKKEAQKAGPPHFPLREEITRQKPPHKTQGLGGFCRFSSVQLQTSRCACICPSSQCLRRVGRADAWPHPPLGTTPATGACGFTPAFLVAWYNLGSIKSTAAGILEQGGRHGPCEVRKQSSLPAHWVFPGRKHIFPGLSPRTSPSPLGGLQISPVLLNHLHMLSSRWGVLPCPASRNLQGETPLLAGLGNG